MLPPKKHSSIFHNALRPNSAVRQLFPATVGQPAAALTHEALRAFEEAKRSHVAAPVVHSDSETDTIRRTIERNALRRSLIKYVFQLLNISRNNITRDLIHSQKKATALRQLAGRANSSVDVRRRRQPQPFRVVRIDGRWLPHGHDGTTRQSGGRGKSTAAQVWHGQELLAELVRVQFVERLHLGLSQDNGHFQSRSTAGAHSGGGRESDRDYSAGLLALILI